MGNKYWRLLGHYTGEAQTYEELAGGFGGSPYTHDEKARLKGVRLITAPEAATSLVENFLIKMSCNTFKPNVIEFGGCGNGLATVPSVPAPVIDYEVDQPVEPGVKITIEGKHAVATAVTANILVMGMFES